MLAKRIIPCLDIKDGRVVKGVNFVNLRDAGDPVEQARLYDEQGADELVFLDISATHEERKTTLELVSRVAETVFMPLTVGGGIREVDDMRNLLLAGADKVSVNSAAVKRPELLSEGAARFGAQCIVLAIDARRNGSSWEVYVAGGRTPTGRATGAPPGTGGWWWKAGESSARLAGHDEGPEVPALGAVPLHAHDLQPLLHQRRLQLGALGVVLQTVASGISSLPLATFLLLMLPIHLAIGLVEGLATAAVALFIRRARPDLLVPGGGTTSSRATLKPLLAALGVAAVVTGGALSWFASSQPDGLEWSIERTAGTELAAPEGGVHGMLARLQEAVSFLPDYGLPKAAHAAEVETAEQLDWPAVDGGTSLAGVVGGAATLVLVWALALLLRRRRR